MSTSGLEETRAFPRFWRLLARNLEITVIWLNGSIFLHGSFIEDCKFYRTNDINGMTRTSLGGLECLAAFNTLYFTMVSVPSITDFRAYLSAEYIATFIRRATSKLPGSWCVLTGESRDYIMLSLRIYKRHSRIHRYHHRTCTIIW